MSSGLSGVVRTARAFTPAPAQPYLAFRAGRAECAMPLSQAREIMSAQRVAPLEGAPAHVRGCLQLRGRTVPVLDFALSLGLKPARGAARGPIIVVEFRQGEISRTVGLAVNTVSEVFPVSELNIREPAAFPNGALREFLSGVVKLKGRKRALVDVQRVLRAVDLSTLQGPAPGKSSPSAI